jgi:hypothetical protein
LPKTPDNLIKALHGFPQSLSANVETAPSNRLHPVPFTIIIPIDIEKESNNPRLSQLLGCPLAQAVSLASHHTGPGSIPGQSM